MTVEMLTDKFFQMEEELDLFSKKIDGVAFWELVRFSVFNEITRQTGVYGQAHKLTDTNIKNVAKYILNAFSNMFIKNPFLAPKADILFFGHPRRKLLDDGLWWDIYCDSIIDNLKDHCKCILLESQHLNTHLLPAKTECIRYFDLPQFWGSILKHTKIVRLSLDRDEKVLLGDLENKINNRFIVQINLIKTVKNHLLSRKIMLPVYTRIIKNIRPKIAVVVVSYGYGTIIEACKDLAIPVVEFQHGNLSKYHVGYSFPEGSVSGLQFPDYLLTFGDYWKGLVKLPIPNSHIIHAGYPHFESEKAKYSGEQRKQQIIFISQGTIGKQLSSFAVKLKKIPDFSWDIVYKLHPGEYVRWRREYPWLIDSGITVMDDNSIPLYKLLAQSTFLVGVYSTVVY